MHYDNSNRASTSMSMTLGHQSSTLRRKDLNKCSRMHTHSSEKVAHLLLYNLVHTCMTNYKTNHSETWSLVFHQWSIPSVSGAKVKHVILKSFSQFQDIRDGKRHEILGISLMFIHLETFKFFKVSAGLFHITGKKAADIAHNTLNVMKLYCIT